MILRSRPVLRSIALFYVVLVQTTLAQTDLPPTATSRMPHSLKLQSIVDEAVSETVVKFAGKQLNTNQIAITLIDLTDAAKPAQAGHRGDEQIYPASVIKLFYLVATHRSLEDGKLQDTEELRRALRDMIVDSLNEATGYIVDLLTGTTSGPELSPSEMEAWYAKRNAVNRYFSSLGYVNINANRKPWCEGPYGREIQSVRMHAPNHRNWLTTDATAHLLSQIALRSAISAARSDQMLELLKRDPFAPGDKNDQAHAYTGLALPPGSKLWSKAGWTSQTRHDAAYVELPNGAKFVLVTFTVDQAGEREIIPTVAKHIVEALGK
jgi:beta-lactamase class A